MMNRRIISNFLCLWSALLLLQCGTGTHAQQDVMRINCGSDVPINDKSGNSWMSDTKYKYGPSSTYSACSRGISFPNYVPWDPILCSERFFFDSGGYKIPVEPGTYAVELLFAELAFTAPNFRVFDVSLQNTSVASNLDLVKQFGYLKVGSMKKNVTVSASTGMIDIYLKASKENPKINGIVITRIGGNDSPVTVPFRINSGYDGIYVDSLNRTWQADQYYVGGAKFGICPATTAGNTLYCTERYASFYKFQYKIPVIAGERYSVNLHFAEFVFEAAGKRMFNVSVQGTQVATKLDIYATVGFRKTYILPVLNIVASPSNPWILIELTNVVENAKISGIEIVKFAGPTNPAPTARPVAPTAKLVAPVRINTGASANWTDPRSSITWSADNYFFGGITYGTTICSNDIDGTLLDALVCSERFFPGSSGQVSGKYVIPMQAGNYTLKLLFAEVIFGPGSRVFSVKVQNKAVITSLDIASSVGRNNAFILSRSVVVGDNDAGLVIEFTNGKENAKINAIEVLDARRGSLETNLGG